MPVSVKIGSPSGNEPSSGKREVGSAGNGPTSRINPVVIVTAIVLLGIVVFALWRFVGAESGSGQSKAMTFPDRAKGPPIPGPPGAGGQASGAGGSASSPARGRMGDGGPVISRSPGGGPMAGGGPSIPGPSGGTR